MKTYKLMFLTDEDKIYPDRPLDNFNYKGDHRDFINCDMIVYTDHNGIRRFQKNRFDDIFMLKPTIANNDSNRHDDFNC